MLRHIIRREWWSTDQDFRRALILWDNQVLAYESQTGEKVSDHGKVTVILEYVPANVRDAFAMSPPEVRNSYVRLRADLRSLYDIRQAVQDPGVSGPRC